MLRHNTLEAQSQRDHGPRNERHNGIEYRRPLHMLAVAPVLLQPAAVHGVELLPGKLKLACRIGHVAQVAVERAVVEARVQRSASLALGNLHFADQDAAEPAEGQAADDEDDED